MSADINPGVQARTSTRERYVLTTVSAGDTEIEGVDLEISELESKEAFLVERLADIAQMRKTKTEELRDVQLQLEEARLVKVCKPEVLEPPGPKALAWVGSMPFDLVCGAVVALNLVVIVLVVKGDLKDDNGPMDNIFLVWYLSELLLKFAYFRHQLFFGSVSEVWINWLDLSIVVGGISFEWVLPVVTQSDGKSRHAQFLGILRMFRVLRVAKLLRVIFTKDLSWMEGQNFQVFMTIVIAANSIMMAAELDHPHWSIWPLLENILLIVYVFELMAKLKFQGKSFFHSSGEAAWNYLDLTIIAGAVFDLWTFPLISFLSPAAAKTKASSDHAFSISKLLRLMRLLRILRLVKLLKKLPPLYRVLAGILEALRAMQWVLVLTAFVLYAFAIFWTTVVGKGGFVDDPTGETQEHFNTVDSSMFYLFLIMNGEFAPAEAIFKYPWGQAVFYIWMVMSNWAILAILTSVVSDNMITSSRRFLDEDEQAKTAERRSLQDQRLCEIFSISLDDGEISSDEWSAVMNDHQKAEVLRTVTHTRHMAKLQEVFMLLSRHSTPNDHRQTQHAFKTRTSNHRTEEHSLEHPESHGIHGGVDDFRVMDHERFLAFVQAKNCPANKQDLLKLLAKVDTLDKKINKVLEANDVPSRTTTRILMDHGRDKPHETEGHHHDREIGRSVTGDLAAGRHHDQEIGR